LVERSQFPAPKSSEEPRDFRRTKPISRAEAERRSARFWSNEANFPRRGRTAQKPDEIDFAPNCPLQTAAPNEPNRGWSA